MRDALSFGLTGIHDAGLVPEDLAFFRRMAEEGKLRLRFYTMLLCPEPRDVYCGDAVERVTGLQDGRWTLQSVKLFGDGALGSRGAALLEDYSDAPGWKGFLLTQDHVWAPLIKQYYDEVRRSSCTR
jgi:predicted amidohydrolase YtcJ